MNSAHRHPGWLTVDSRKTFANEIEPNAHIIEAEKRQTAADHCVSSWTGVQDLSGLKSSID